jgi:hypothetical protein
MPQTPYSIEYSSGFCEVQREASGIDVLDGSPWAHELKHEAIGCKSTSATDVCASNTINGANWC